jgi:hypothetical protein
VLVRIERWTRHDRRYAIVEHPDGGTLRLPLDWTDRAPPWVSPHVDGRPVRLSTGGMLRLTAAVGVALGRTLAEAEDRAESSRFNPVQGSADAAKNVRDRLGQSARRGSAQRPRSVGGARAQVAAGSKERRGGHR